MFEGADTTHIQDHTGSKLESFGLKFTKIYLAVLFFGIATSSFFGAIELEPLKLNELGDFLAGAFGPLAIFWLVLGFFQQGRELRHSVRALELQAEELKNSVEQQKEMVGITEQQLKLDIAVREDQTLATRSKDLPFFQLRGGSSSSSGGSRRYTFLAKNVGAATLGCKLSLQENSEVTLTTKTIGYLASEQEQQVQVHSVDGQLLDNSKEYLLTLESRNIRDQVRRQVFAIRNGTPILSECDPELL